MTIVFERPLVLIGAGKMGGALLAGWLRDGILSTQIIVRDPTPAPDVARLIAEQGIPLNFPVADISARKPALVLLAVKPQAFATVLPELKPLVVPETLFLSIAAGIGLTRIDELLGGGAHVVRAMPNTPASVGRGMTGAFANARVTPMQHALAQSLLGTVGEVGWVKDEALIDAVTAISGSGPAYVFYLVECLAAAGEALGLSSALAMQFARATISGAGEMLHRQGEPAETLRNNVTSPAGTTAAALKVLMGEDGLMQLMRRAVEAARDRAIELGQ